MKAYRKQQTDIKAISKMHFTVIQESNKNGLTLCQYHGLITIESEENGTVDLLYNISCCNTHDAIELAESLLFSVESISGEDDYCTSYSLDKEVLDFATQYHITRMKFNPRE